MRRHIPLDLESTGSSSLFAINHQTWPSGASRHTNLGEAGAVDALPRLPQFLLPREMAA
jgi:hypothetical protein